MKIRYVKYIVVVVNVCFIYSAIDAYFFQPKFDTNGYFVIFMMFLMILYNIYVGFITYVSKKISDKYKYVISTLLCALPLFFIIYNFVSKWLYLMYLDN